MAPACVKDHSAVPPYCAVLTESKALELQVLFWESRVATAGTSATTGTSVSCCVAVEQPSLDTFDGSKKLASPPPSPPADESDMLQVTFVGAVTPVMPVTSLVGSTTTPGPLMTVHVPESVAMLREPWRVAVEELQRGEGEEKIGVGMKGIGATSIITVDEDVKEAQAG